MTAAASHRMFFEWRPAADGKRGRWVKRPRPAGYRATGEHSPARREAKRLLTPTVRTGITMSADYTCTYCEQRGDSFNGPDGAPWTMDHVIPLERGGEPGPRNVVLSCATCNREKGSRTPEEWRDA